MPEFETHRVVKTRVVKLKGDTYAVTFTYDDGTEDFVGVGHKDAAEFYAKVQKGETFPVNTHPLLFECREGGEATQEKLVAAP